MSRSLIIRSAITSALLGGSITWLLGRARSSGLPRHVIPIVTPVITMRFAEEVLERLEHAPGEEVFVVLHTDGGEVAACVLIADALRKFPRSTAVVPYMAFSGGTIVALNAPSSTASARGTSSRPRTTSRTRFIRSPPSTARRSRATCAGRSVSASRTHRRPRSSGR